MISDFGGRTVVPQNGVVPTDVDTGPTGMYGAIVVAPTNSTFTKPSFDRSRDQHGRPGRRARAGCRAPTATSRSSCRTNDDSIGQSHMPYPTDVKGITTVNYRSGKRTVNDVDPAYSSAERRSRHADPQGLRRRPGRGARDRRTGQRADAHLQPRRLSRGRSIRSSRWPSRSRLADSAPGRDSRPTSPAAPAVAASSATCSTATCAGRSPQAACGACSGSWRTAAARSSRSTGSAARAGRTVAGRARQADARSGQRHRHLRPSTTSRRTRCRRSRAPQPRTRRSTSTWTASRSLRARRQPTAAGRSARRP